MAKPRFCLGHVQVRGSINFLWNWGCCRVRENSWLGRKLLAFQDETSSVVSVIGYLVNADSLRCWKSHTNIISKSETEFRSEMYVSNFENIEWTLLTNGNFMLRSGWIPSTLWMSKQLTTNNLNIRVNTGKSANISESHREIFRDAEHLSQKQTDRQIYTMSRIVLMTSPVKFDFKHCWIQFIQSFMMYRAVYQ